MADVSPLAKYKEVAKKFNFGEGKEVPDEIKQSFIQDQINEMRSICNRLIIDIVGAHAGMAEAKDETSRSAYLSAIANQESDLRQYSKKLDTLITLNQELSANGQISSNPAQ